MIEAFLMAVVVVGGLWVMGSVVVGLGAVAVRSEQADRRREAREEAWDSVQQESPAEFACVGVCIVSRGRNLTGAYTRTAEEETAVRQAMEWTQEDQQQLADGYEADRIVAGRGWATVEAPAEWEPVEEDAVPVRRW